MFIDEKYEGIDFTQMNAWLDDLVSMGRKHNTIVMHRNNVRQCLLALRNAGRSTDAFSLMSDDVLFLWKSMELKESVKWAYLRSLANMVSFHTGKDIVKDARILHNRVETDRVFISKDTFVKVYGIGDEFQRLVLCLGAYMGLRRAEMASIRDCDIRDGMLRVHGKGHGDSGLIVNLPIPAPVNVAIQNYRKSPLKNGIRRDDYLLQAHDRNGDLHGVSPSRISDSVRDLGKRASVKITTHALRRFFATTLYYDVGCDLQTMKGLMRHADISTTLKCYVNADDRKEREASQRLSDCLEALMRECQV